MLEAQTFTIIDHSDGLHIFTQLIWIKRKKTGRDRGEGGKAVIKLRELCISTKSYTLYCISGLGRSTRPCLEYYCNINPSTLYYYDGFCFVISRFSTHPFALRGALLLQHLTISYFCLHEVLLRGWQKETFGIHRADNVVPHGAALSVVATHSSWEKLL